MHAYLIIDLKISDLAGFMVYAERIPALIEKHSGRYIVQGVEPTVIEGSDDDIERSVILEFPNRSAAQAFLEERSRSDLHSIWADTTNSRILLVDGCS